MNSLRYRLRQQWGVLPFESTRADLWWRGACPASCRLASCVAEGDTVQVHYTDEALWSLAGPGKEGRAGFLHNLLSRFGALPGPLESDLRPLFVWLERVQYWVGEGGKPARARHFAEKLRGQLNSLYEREPLLGLEQHSKGYPRLAQLAGLAGGLEALCKT